MRWGLQSGTLDALLPYAKPLTLAARETNCPLFVVYAIAWRETIYGETQGWWDAATVVSEDGGHGILQLTTPPIPDAWADPQTLATAAIKQDLLPALKWWNETYRYVGTVLLKCAAAEYNAGRSRALQGHALGNVDALTTDGYATAVVGFYENLCKTSRP